MTAEELIATWRKRSDDPIAHIFTTYSICADELAAILPEIRREAGDERELKLRYQLAKCRTGDNSIVIDARHNSQRLAELQGPAKESVTCQHCGRPIEMRNGEWRHTMYHGAYCTKPAQPGPPEPAKEAAK